MAWDIIYHDNEPNEPTIGDIWPENDWRNSKILSRKYRTETSLYRPPLVVMLPSVYTLRGDPFVIDRAVNGDVLCRGWNIIINGDMVNGQKLHLTMSPSINSVGSYGTITDGVISDDMEGRDYRPVTD